MTTDDETRLQEILTRAAEDPPAPAPDPDVLARIVDRGARRRHVKTGLLAGAGAVVAVLLVGASITHRDAGIDTATGGRPATIQLAPATGTAGRPGPTGTTGEAPAGPGPTGTTEPSTPPTASAPTTTVPVTTTWPAPVTTTVPPTEPDPTDPTDPTTPDPTETTVPGGTLDCGTQYLATGWPTTFAPSRQMGECIVAAFDAGRPATYAERAQTDGEGGHIKITRYDVTARRVVVVTVDATGALPPGGVTSQTCHSLTLDSMLPIASACS